MCWQTYSSGGLKNILVERIDSIEPTLAHVVPEFTSNLLGPVMVLVYLFTIDWRMALVSLVTVPIGAACMAGMFKGYDESNRRCIAKTKVLNDTAVEYIGGIDVIKVFGKEDSSYEKFVNAARSAADAYVNWMKRCNFYFSMSMSVMPATLVAVLPVGGMFVRAGTLAPEAFIMCIVLSLGLIGPIITAMSYTDDLAELDTVVAEVTSILASPEQDRPTVSAAAPVDTSVQLDNVRFSYAEDEVLHGVSLGMEEGQTCALVGPSGSGKSTIARLVAGLWDTDSGSVSIGGVDVCDLSTDDFSQLVSYVSQNNYLFDDTVRENIRMGKPGATDEEVEAIARASGCHDFISGLQDGYDTMVGAAGANLSGGERQRIAIARAMLKDAPVVILDEATAYMDPENEAIVQDAVARLTKDKTLGVVAHRLSTIQHANNIAVVQDGNLVEEGTHDALLSAGGTYARMWEAHTAVRDTAEVEGGSTC